MRVAIVHDWLTAYAGAEFVLEKMLHIFPQADIYCLVDHMPESQRGFLSNHKITTSFIQNLPFSRKKYRAYLTLMPLAIEQFDLSEYDLVISSSHAIAKGVITGPDQLHICYIYSPVRYAWDLQHQYLRESGLTQGLKSIVARIILHYIRIWDVRTANGVDHFVSISNYIRRRVYKTYRRESEVIFPPVDTDFFTPGEEKQDYYLTASRMVPYKRIPLIVEAFAQMPNRKLIVIGDGPDYEKVKKKAEGFRNIEILGYQDRQKLRGYMQHARAFVFAAEEDFGIAPLEAQACGTPVICYGKGGVVDTVVDGETGIFFKNQSVKDILGALERFEASKFDANIVRRQAERFSTENFSSKFKNFVYHKVP